ncbi:MAG: HAMP domain-containing protein [Planctomycetes bacterium]|nr:HAMP domain-containing protein [Planctomycetota bacterium]
MSLLAPRRLRTRFVLAGLAVVVATVAAGAFSVATFAAFSRDVGQELRRSRELIDLAAGMAGALEREDDALLVALTGDLARARRELAEQRATFDRLRLELEHAVNGGPPALAERAGGPGPAPAARGQAPPGPGGERSVGRAGHTAEPGEEEVAAAVAAHVAAYRAVGDELLAEAPRPAARERYHEAVNPALRRTLEDCERLRELGFRSMERTGLQARDRALGATGAVAAISAGGLLVTVVVALRLARTIIEPVGRLTDSVEAVRQGDFDRRVEVTSPDELGQLAEGFNRMAAALGELRRSDLGLAIRAKETLEATLHALPDAVLLVDPDGRIATANHRGRLVLAALEAAGAARIDDVPLPPDGRRAVREALRGEAPPVDRVERLRLRVALDGRALQLLPLAVPVPDYAPGRSGAVVALTDVTDFDRLDQLRMELVAVASHELKTPLTTLRMNLLLLAERRDALDARQQEILDTALTGCEELAETIEELLDLARIEGGQLRLALEPVDLRAVIARATGALRGRFEDAGVALEAAVDHPAPVVRGDPRRLTNVLTNLLSNALKYTPGGGRVVVEVSRRDAGSAPGGLLQIAVTDTGRGIPQDLRERVFEKFFRVEHVRPDVTRSVPGAGLGLYLCRQVVAAHGGSIHAEAGPGDVGTRVAVSLPPADGEGAGGWRAGDASVGE